MAMSGLTAKGPPRYQPSPPRRPPPRHYPKDLERQFAADPFDKRMVVGPSTDRHLTPLGLLVNVWWWYRKYPQECGPAFAPVAASIERLLRRECPDAVKELEQHDG